VNSERFNCIMAVLGPYELTLLENQFVGLGVCRRTVCESFVLPLSALFGPNNRVFNATIYFL